MLLCLHGFASGRTAARIAPRRCRGLGACSAPECTLHAGETTAQEWFTRFHKSVATSSLLLTSGHHDSLYSLALPFWVCVNISAELC